MMENVEANKVFTTSFAMWPSTTAWVSSDLSTLLKNRWMALGMTHALTFS